MLYVIYIAIDTDRHDEWLSYMRDEHLQDVLDTDCFADVTMARDPESDTGERTAYRIVYRAHSGEAFERYEEQYAADLQADHTSRYAGSFDAHREILPIVTRLKSSNNTSEPGS